MLVKWDGKHIAQMLIQPNMKPRITFDCETIIAQQTMIFWHSITVE